jgi:hypothetical protein
MNKGEGAPAMRDEETGPLRHDASTVPPLHSFDESLDALFGPEDKPAYATQKGGIRPTMELRQADSQEPMVRVHHCEGSIEEIPVDQVAESVGEAGKTSTRFPEADFGEEYHGQTDSGESIWQRTMLGGKQ